MLWLEVAGKGRYFDFGFVGEKIAYALSQGLKVVTCVGETLAQREAGTTMEVVAAQTQAIILPRIVLEAIPLDFLKKEERAKIKFQAVLLVAKEVASTSSKLIAPHASMLQICHLHFFCRLNALCLGDRVIMYLPRCADTNSKVGKFLLSFLIYLSLPRLVASSYTTHIESSHAALSSLWDNVVLAYEPVWATGTGKVASPEQAQVVG
ncbi:triosephosphate isomerase, cytosolic-like protein [Tanacetum coccineum]